MIVEKDIFIKNSMAIPSKVSFFIQAKSKEDIGEAVAFAEQKGLPLITIGDSTNTIPRSTTDSVILFLDFKGIEKSNEIITVQAGEKWDDVVDFAVKNNLSGIEALSAIPGRVGAAPIQNIGAYGAEISDTLESLEAYNTRDKKFVILNNKDCQFTYRDSLFKKNKDQFIITSIKLKLKKESSKIPDYKDVKKYFEEIKNISPTLLEIRNAIIEIRKNKLPDPKVVPNCGSFFKNPFVEKEKADELKKEYPDIPIFLNNNNIKIPAGFLIEQAGLKGQRVGNMEIYKNNALVLTNPYKANFGDLEKAEKIIKEKVLEKFGISLEREPVII